MALASSAGAFELSFPADCSLGTECFIQQYPDHEPGPEAQDFTCGPLSYDGHDGTDIALPSLAAMAAGVDVLAAASGTVKGRRDGVPDATPFPAGQDCGNGVLVDHGGGWETQYCHLKQGSVTVKVGDAVLTGAVLGQIGQSGAADFPHVHLSLRHNGRDLDPFAPDAAAACGSPGPGLWQPPIAYAAGGLLDVGIASEVPLFSAIKAGLPSPDLKADAPALVVWAYLYGSRAGDAILFTLQGPEGEILTERTLLERTQAQAFRAVGKRLKGDGWPRGRYTGTARFLREAQELGRQEIDIEVK